MPFFVLTDANFFIFLELWDDLIQRIEKHYPAHNPAIVEIELVQIEKNGEEIKPLGFKNLLKSPGTISNREEQRRMEKKPNIEVSRTYSKLQVQSQIEKNGEESKP